MSGKKYSADEIVKQVALHAVGCNALVFLDNRLDSYLVVDRAVDSTDGTHVDFFKGGASVARLRTSVVKGFA